MIDRARTSLLAFTLFTFPEYEVNWHHRALCSVLDRFARKEIRFLIICAPPRHGKSEIVSRRLPAFLHGMYPDDEIMATSYNSTLACDMTIDVQRIMDTPEYRQVFPESSITTTGSKTSYSRNSEEHELIGRKGSYRGQGVGGSFTGRGANFCFIAGTNVLTKDGKVPIEQLKVGDLVWSYSHDKKIRERKRISNISIRRTTQLVQVETTYGCQVLSTPEHPFFSERRGYTHARALERGEVLWSTRLHQKKNSLPTYLYFMWKDFRKNKIRIYESIKERAQRLLLRSRVLEQTSQLQESQKMLDMRSTDAIEKLSILFREVQAESEKTAKRNSISSLRSMRKIISISSLLSIKILFNVLQRLSSFCSYFWEEQSKIQRWIRKSIPISVLQAQTTHIRSRYEPVFGLSVGSQTSRASHRREQEYQHMGQSDYPLQFLPHHPSQIIRDTVSSVTEISCEPVEVYDIEVEGNHNFFAENLLVHNCIIDDPIKGREDADSEVFRERLWKFYTGTLRPRLEKNGSILLTLTRWHSDDLFGRIVKQGEDPSADQWEVFKFPAIKEDDLNPLDPREIGEPLWPNKYNLKDLMALKANGTRDWNSLYQQRPSAEEGNIINRNWWKYYTEAPGRFDEVIQSWDLAFTAKAKSDFVVGQVWGRVGSSKYLLDQVRGRLSFNNSVQAIIQLSNKWPSARLKLIENKANGPAVEDVLRKTVPGIVLVEPMGDKVARVNAVAPTIEAGNVYLPQNCAWIHDFVSECSDFPNATFDDCVDAMSQALRRLEQRKPMHGPISGHGMM
jgi:predicted phage terminase large subunit-like protein